MKSYNAIKLNRGDYFIFDKKTLASFLESIDVDFFDTYDLSIEKIGEEKWRVGFPDKNNEYITLKKFYTYE